MDQKPKKTNRYSERVLKRNNAEPLVSIITVCRNSEKTIAKTIESVLHQSNTDYEYLIIDGASSDRTIEIVKYYEPQFKGRLRWVSEKDAGIYDAMNKGITIASGKIIGIINSDDWYELDAVELIARAYRINGNAVYYGILRCLEDGKEVMLKSVNYQFIHTEHVGHPAYFVARQIYQQHGLYSLDYKYSSDYELMMRLVARQVVFIQIDRIIANYSSGGASLQNTLMTLNEHLKIRHRYNYLTKRGMLLRMLKNRILLMLRGITMFL